MYFEILICGLKHDPLFTYTNTYTKHHTCKSREVISSTYNRGCVQVFSQMQMVLIYSNVFELILS